MRLVNNVRGFSLVELVIVILLVGILAVVTLPMLMAGFNAFTQQQKTAEVERESMLALERIAREVRMSTNFTVNAGTSIQFNRPGGAAVEIRLDAGRIILDAGSVNVLARNVGSFSPEGPIAFEDACYLKLEFTTAPSLTWRQVVFLRNVSSC